jgi:RNA polymerase sigma factor (sigma-70 family)
MSDIPATRASLLVRLRNPRDDAAWREFVTLYAPLIYHYARKQGLQDADAVDLSQDIISAVAGAVSQFEYDPQRGAFRSWLLTVVRRKLANWRRSQSIRLRGSGDTATHRVLEQLAEPAGRDDDWETEWEQQLFAWACGEVRRDVADVTWQAFWKTAIEDLPGKQVAAELGISVASVYQARSRIVTRLKELIKFVQEP